MNGEDGVATENESVYMERSGSVHIRTSGEQRTLWIEAGEPSLGLLEEGERGRGLWDMAD